MSAHAVYSPSSAHRWIPCPGSIPLVEALGRVDTASVFSAEGTVAHEIAARCLVEQKEAAEFVGVTIGQDGFQISVDTDMASHIQAYVDAIRRRVGPKESEIQVDLSNVLGVEGQFGTADAIVFAPDALEVHDLKFGRGHRVDAERNEQMMLYALGALDMYGIIQDWQKVRMTIHQPRLDHISEWECAVAELRTFEENATDAVMLSQLAKGEKHLFLNPGDKQCQWCPAKATCPALRDHVAQTCFEDISAEKVRPVPMGLNELAAARAKVALVEGWAAAVVKATEEALLAGYNVPGWKVVNGRKGNRAWIDAAEAEAALRARLKVDEVYTKTLITPPKAEKLLTEKQWTKFAALVTQSEGKPQVVPESDAREAISRADDFENLTE